MYDRGQINLIAGWSLAGYRNKDGRVVCQLEIQPSQQSGPGSLRLPLP